MPTLKNQLGRSKAVKPSPMPTAERRNVSDCLSVTNCIIRLIGTLPVDDLPAPVAAAIDVMANGAIAVVIAAKRAELGVVTESEAP